MDFKFFAVMFGSIACSATAQLLLKVGMSNERIQRLLSEGPPLLLAFAICANFYVLVGFGFYVIAAVSWLFVLSKVDVTFAYPFIGVGFLLTMAFGFVFLNEKVGLIRLLGTLLVALGIILVSQSS